MYNNLKKTSDKQTSGSRVTSPSTSSVKEDTSPVNMSHPEHHSERQSPCKPISSRPISTMYFSKPSQTKPIRDHTISEQSQSLSTVVESDTEASLSTDDTSVGIPPKSLTYMRDNLRNIIGMMGDDNGIPDTPTSQDVSAFSSDACNPFCNVRESPCYQAKELAIPRKENRHVEEVYYNENVQPCYFRGHVEDPERPQQERQSEDREQGVCSRSRCPANTSPPPPQYEAEVCENQCRRCVSPAVPTVPALVVPGPEGQRCACVMQEVVVEDEECPCDCEPGPNSPCVSKRTAAERIKDLYNRMVGSEPKVQYMFNMNNVQPPPRRLIFDLVEGIPSAAPAPVVQQPPLGDVKKTDLPKKEASVKKKVETPVKKKEESEKKKEKPVKKKDIIKKSYEISTDEKVEIYYFDHGNSGYYRTTDNPPPLITDDFFEQTDLYATRFWAEIFGTLHIGFAFVTALILQFIRFVLYSIVRPLTIGVIQMTSDYFFKPLLSILFNGIIQPVLILAYNTATSLRDLCEPIAQAFGFFVRVVAELFRALRLVEVNACMPSRVVEVNACKPLRPEICSSKIV